MLNTRKHFPNLLNQLGLIGNAAEIGVYKGDFSKLLLSNWEGAMLFSIDPWRYQENARFDSSNIEQEEHDEAYKIARTTLAQFGPRSKIIRDFSVNASARFENESLDFVYIDARHDYRSVNSDLNAWWPKIKLGGIIAGHDYKDSFVRLNLVEVKRAVNDFFWTKGQINVTIEDNLPSWYVLKEKTIS